MNRIFRPSFELFLGESLKNFKDERLALAILHAAVALEVMLKAKLRDLQPGAEIVKVRKDGSVLSMGLDDLKKALSSRGVQIVRSDERLITRLVFWRNDIAHYVPTHTKSEAKSKLADAYQLIAKFLRELFRESARSYLSAADYRRFKQWIASREDLETNAREAAQRRCGGIRGLYCPKCSAFETVRFSNGQGYCHSCRSRFSLRKDDVCHRCGQLFPVAETCPCWEE